MIYLNVCQANAQGHIFFLSSFVVLIEMNIETHTTQTWISVRFELQFHFWNTLINQFLKLYLLFGKTFCIYIFPHYIFNLNDFILYSFNLFRCYLFASWIHILDDDAIWYTLKDVTSTKWKWKRNEYGNKEESKINIIMVVISCHLFFISVSCFRMV